MHYSPLGAAEAATFWLQPLKCWGRGLRSRKYMAGAWEVAIKCKAKNHKTWHTSTSLLQKSVADNQFMVTPAHALVLPFHYELCHALSTLHWLLKLWHGSIASSELGKPCKHWITMLSSTASVRVQWGFSTRLWSKDCVYHGYIFQLTGYPAVFHMYISFLCLPMTGGVYFCLPLLLR